MHNLTNKLGGSHLLILFVEVSYSVFFDLAPLAPFLALELAVGKGVGGDTLKTSAGPSPRCPNCGEDSLVFKYARVQLSIF
jgi:hypothetical protein